MAKELSEVDALKAVDEALSGLGDADAKNRVLAWAWDKYSTQPKPATDEAEVDATPAPKRSKKKTTKRKTAKKSSAKKTTLSIVKDLNLKPKGKKAFKDFAAEKQPGSNGDKCVVAVYYLSHELELEKVSAAHVSTCFRHMKWKQPADILNTLAWTASTKGCLDTQDMDDIKLTVIGGNRIEHELPAESEK